eukprot:355077-Chlamydomonas_euryale.AAC.5
MSWRPHGASAHMGGAGSGNGRFCSDVTHRSPASKVGRRRRANRMMRALAGLLLPRCSLFWDARTRAAGAWLPVADIVIIATLSW